LLRQRIRARQNAATQVILTFWDAVNRPRQILSADERAFLDRMGSLNEEEIERLSVREIIADLNIMHKVDPRSVRDAFEEAFIDCGLTNSEVLRLVERAKWKQ
jgi:hypothetical protein